MKRFVSRFITDCACKCRKKAEWYLKRDLATMLDEKAIQLTFEAKGEGHAENDYMIEDRDNFCVVCASHKDLTLHHVVCPISTVSGASLL